MSTTERNKRRIARMDTWISHAEAAAGDDDTHLRFLFYWIAYEAAYQTYPVAGHGGKARESLHWKLADRDTGRLQGILYAKKHDVLRILRLRQAHPYFWYKPEKNTSVGTVKEWNRIFSGKVERAEKHLDKARSGRREAIRETLNDLFLNLSVVRNQIVHGASAGSGGWGRTQYELGAKLLKALIPCFREVIRSNTLVSQENSRKIL